MIRNGRSEPGWTFHTEAFLGWLWWCARRAWKRWRTRTRERVRARASSLTPSAPVGPIGLARVVGQRRAVETLRLLARAAQLPGAGGRFPHLALLGPAGCGKTYTARCLADELQAQGAYLNGTALTVDALWGELERVQHAPRALVMVDEAHAMARAPSEALLSVLEAPATLSRTRKGQLERLPVAPTVTFALATTERADLSEPLLSRLVLIELGDYAPSELAEIGRRHLAELAPGLQIAPGLLEAIGPLAPSVRELKGWLRLLAAQEDHGTITGEDWRRLRATLDLDERGHGRLERAYLEALRRGPLALQQLAALLRMSADDVRARLEPKLLREGLIRVTGRGRELAE